MLLMMLLLGPLLIALFCLWIHTLSRIAEPSIRLTHGDARIIGGVTGVYVAVVVAIWLVGG